MRMRGLPYGLLRAHAAIDTTTVGRQAVAASRAFASSKMSYEAQLQDKVVKLALRFQDFKMPEMQVRVRAAEPWWLSWAASVYKGRDTMCSGRHFIGAAQV
jgi:hypothetical protein